MKHLKKLVLTYLIFQCFSLDAQFSEKIVVWSGEADAHEIYATDINNDGLNDLIGCTQDELILFINRGNLQFDELILESNLNASFFSVHAADFNEDGWMDIVSATENDGDISWYQNMGNETFSSKKVIESGNRSRDVITADIDNDGDIDILANFVPAGTNSDLVVYYKNDGNGQFGNRIFLASGLNRVDCVLPFDIDDDGDLDVFASDLINDKVWMMENLGNGNFDTSKSIADDVNGAQSLSIADYNNDGRYDIAIATRNSASSVMSISYNEDGSFTTPVRIQFIITNSQINTVLFEDLDLDGNVELLLADDNASNIAYLQNLGTSFLQNEIIVNPNASRASCVFATDMDSDSDSEIIYALRDGKEMGYYVNSILSSTDDPVSDAFEIFPNPATEYIETSLDPNKILNMNIYSVSGSQHIRKPITNYSKIELNTLSTGTYILYITTTDGKYAKQFIKE